MEPSLPFGTRQSPFDPPWLRVVKVATLIVGALLVLLGLISGVIYLLLALLAPRLTGTQPIGGLAVSFSLAVLAIALGSALIYHSVTALQAKRSTPFTLPHPSLLLAGFVIIIVLGSLTQLSSTGAWLVFPVFYLLGLALPIAAILSWACRLTDSGTWRDVILYFSNGAFIATNIAVFLEMAALVSMIAIGAFAAPLIPGGTEMLQELSAQLQSTGPQSPQLIRNLLSSPVIIFTLFFVLAIIVPLIEEMCKAIGVLLTAYRRPTRRQAIWWGLLGGAGFALTEGLLNSSLSLGELTWGLLALLRVGTSLVHCTTAGLVGLGWYNLLRHRSFAAWARGYLKAVGLHGAWNALSISLLLLPENAARGNRWAAAGTLIVFVLLTAGGVLVGIILIRLLHTSDEESLTSHLLHP